MQITDFEKNTIWPILPHTLEGMMRNVVDLNKTSQLTEKTVGFMFQKEEEKDFALKDGVAFIPICGPITKGRTFLSYFFGGSTTASIMQLLKSAMDDSDVEAIVLDINSPGGTLPGLESLSTYIYESKDEKPIIAYTDGMMCSAAYWIGSAASAIVAQTTAEVGSIGVLQVHYDYSKWDEMDGLKRTFLTAGKYKAVGNNAEPLSDEARKVMQGELDYIYTVFVDTVARNRGTDAETVLKEMADGRVFIGQQAADAGLVDMIGNMDDTMELAESLMDGADTVLTGRGMASVNLTISKEDKEMTKKKVDTQDAPPIESVDQLEAMYPDLAKALVDRGASVSNEAAVAEAVSAETARVLGLVEVQFGQESGESFKAIVDTGVTVDQFKAIRGGQAEASTPESKEDKIKENLLDAIHGAASDPVGSGGGGNLDFGVLVEQRMIAAQCSKSDAITYCMANYQDQHKAWLKKVQPEGTA